MTLEKHFQQIRKLYFAQWDRAGEWKVRRTNKPLSGEARYEEKLILIGRGCEGDDLIMIHEIAHAVTKANHSSKWLKRMIAAAEKAHNLGNSELEKRLRDEVTAYQNPQRYQKLTVKVVYSTIEDDVSESPGITFRGAVEHVGNLIGSSYDEMIQQYPRLRKIYEKARRQVEREKRRIEAFKAIQMERGQKTG